MSTETSEPTTNVDYYIDNVRRACDGLETYGQTTVAAKVRQALAQALSGREAPRVTRTPQADENGIPRRSRIDLHTPAERACREAMLSVEAMRAHPLLTDAVTLIFRAQAAVADYLELPASSKGLTDQAAATELIPAATSGIDLIGIERRRQQVELCWTEHHDDGHFKGELARAAKCYETSPDAREFVNGVPAEWPWGPNWWRPCPDDRVRELVKAGAVYLAEQERLERINRVLQRRFAPDAREARSLRNEIVAASGRVRAVAAEIDRIRGVAPTPAVAKDVG